MITNGKRWTAVAAVLVMAGWTAGPAQAQFRAGLGVGMAGERGMGRIMGMNRLVNFGGLGGGGINPYGYGGFMPYAWQDPFNGYLTGGASVIQAQSQFMIATQQAQLMKEQVKQSRLETRKQVVQEWLWEREHIPSLEQIREEARQLDLRRSLNDPPINEIMSADSLNNLLDGLQKRSETGVPIELDPEMLKHINVRAPTMGVGNFGLLKDKGPLVWPVAIQLLQPADEVSEVRTQIDTLVREALSQARSGQVDAAVVNGIRVNAQKMEAMLKKQITVVPFSQYMDAKRFLSDLEDAQKVLQHRDATKFVNGTYAARGSTVQELVRNMTTEGLRFAPATPGDEAAYLSLQRGMAEALSAAGGLVANQPPPPPEPK